MRICALTSKIPSTGLLRAIVAALIVASAATTYGIAWSQEPASAAAEQQAAEDLGVEWPALGPSPTDRPVGDTLTVELITQVGDTPAGGDGNPVASLNLPFTDGSGQPGFTGTIDLGVSTEGFVWSGADILWRNSDATSNLLTGAEAYMGVGDGGPFIYSPAIDGDDGVWSQNGLVAVEGTQAPGFPVGTDSTFHSRPTMTPGGRAFWISGFNETGGTATEGRMVYSSPTASSGDIQVVLRSDDVVGGFPIDRPSGIQFDYQFSDSGMHHIHDLLLDTGSTIDDGVVYVDGLVAARESQPTGEGDNWDNFDLMTIDDEGDYLFSGDTDGDIGTDEFIAHNATIVLREGDSAGGITLTTSAFVRGLSLNNRGEAVHLWGIGDSSEHLFFACNASSLRGTSSVRLLSTGDVVDVDDDGIGDATVTDFNTFGASFSLAEDDRAVVGVDLDYGAGEIGAIIAIDLFPCSIFTDGFESGDTSAWSNSVP